MRISDWSSDVCSSDLASAALPPKPAPAHPAAAAPLPQGLTGMTTGASGWKVELIVPAHAAEIFAAALAPLSTATAEFEVDDGSRDPPWRVTADFDDMPDRAALVAAIALAAARAGVAE